MQLKKRKLKNLTGINEKENWLDDDTNINSEKAQTMLESTGATL